MNELVQEAQPGGRPPKTTVDDVNSFMRPAGNSQQRAARVLRNRAQALAAYFKAQGLGLEMQNDAAELKLSAERKAGTLLVEMDKNLGGQAEHESYPSHDATGRPPPLAELGITRDQSSRWQLEASVPEERYERFLAETREWRRPAPLLLAARIGARLGVGSRGVGSGPTALAAVAARPHRAKRSRRCLEAFVVVPWPYSPEHPP